LVNSPSQRSKRYSTRPGSDVPWLIGRACAGEWPYDPKWLTRLRHPAMRAQFQREMRMFVVPDLQDRTVAVGVEVIRREARRLLEFREVKHFEVRSSRQQDCRADPHSACDGGGCDGCRGLGVVLVVDRGRYVDLMGWIAVLRVA
jgi:hypothetical protein